MRKEVKKLINLAHEMEKKGKIKEQKREAVYYSGHIFDTYYVPIPMTNAHDKLMGICQEVYDDEDGCFGGYETVMKFSKQEQYALKLAGF